MRGIIQSMKNGRSKRNSKEKRTDENAERSISAEALRGVVAIFCVAFAGFLILSQLGGGGTFGNITFATFSWLLGVGYSLLPLSLFMLAVLIFRSVEKHFG
ncbi:MAG: hypothetical protein RIQ56_353, partial [Candidatus Parcubacteria bacterium]